MGYAAVNERTLRRSLFKVIAGVLIVAALLPAGSATALTPTVSAWMHQGVEWEQQRDDSPRLAVDIAHVEPGAPIALRPVVSNGQLFENPPGARNTTTSAMCSAAGGIVCVNADYWVCSTCGVPIGGIIRDGVPLRSPSRDHEQVTMLDDGRMVTSRLELELELVATFSPEPPPAPVDPPPTIPPIDSAEASAAPSDESREVRLPIDAINRQAPNGVVLYSPTWATTTQTPPESVEALFTGPVPRVGSRADVKLVSTGGPDSPIPADGFLLSATGSARQDFAEQLDVIREADRIELLVQANMPAAMSIGGHPVLLRDGDRMPLNQDDPKISNRHPRTLIGWNDEGHLWLVTVDGRQARRSVGMTLSEATDFLKDLGATDAMNLDGGGSSTFVTGVPCTDGRTPCIRNSPSEGHERAIPTALAVIPAAGTTLSNVPTPAPPPPPPTTVRKPRAPAAPRPTSPPTVPAPTTAPPATVPVTTLVTTPPTPPSTIPAKPRPAKPYKISTDPQPVQEMTVAGLAFAVTASGVSSWFRSRRSRRRRRQPELVRLSASVETPPKDRGRTRFRRR